MYSPEISRPLVQAARGSARLLNTATPGTRMSDGRSPRPAAARLKLLPNMRPCRHKHNRQAGASVAACQHKTDLIRSAAVAAQPLCVLPALQHNSQFSNAASSYSRWQTYALLGNQNCPRNWVANLQLLLSAVCECSGMQRAGSALQLLCVSC